MGRGPAPQPADKKKLKGNPGGRPPMDSPSPPPVKKLRCPSWIPKHGKKLWRRLCPQLMEEGIITEWDITSFEAMCMAYHMMREAQELIASEGLTVKAERGDTIKKHPAFTLYKENANLYRQFAELFGLSPVSRQRLKIKPKEVDEMDDFLQ